MITAEDFLILKGDKNFRLSMSGEYISDIMIDFAKIHVTEALRQASEKAESIEGWNTGFSGSASSIDKDSILNAYPLDKIK
jgi:hypothetical protein